MEGLLSQKLATQSMNIASCTRSKFSIESTEHSLQAEAPTVIAENSSSIMASSSGADFEARVQAEVAKVISNMMAAGNTAAS